MKTHQLLNSVKIHNLYVLSAIFAGHQFMAIAEAIKAMTSLMRKRMHHCLKDVVSEKKTFEQ